MHTRRSCLKGSALLALYAWAGTGSLAMSESLSGLATGLVVIDTGLPGAAGLARRVGSEARVEMLGDDVADLFYGRLVPHWRAHGVRGLAGVTRAPALYLLETLAADYGLRMVDFERAPMREALLGGDDAAFAWCMAPRRHPIHAGITVIST